MTQHCDPIADVQNSADTRQIAINKVGIKSVRHPVRIQDRNGDALGPHDSTERRGLPGLSQPDIESGQEFFPGLQG